MSCWLIIVFSLHLVFVLLFLLLNLRNFPINLNNCKYLLEFLAKRLKYSTNLKYLINVVILNLTESPLIFIILLTFRDLRCCFSIYYSILIKYFKYSQLCLKFLSKCLRLFTELFGRVDTIKLCQIKTQLSNNLSDIDQ